MMRSFLVYAYSPVFGLEKVVRLFVFAPIIPKTTMMIRIIILISIREIIICYDGLSKWVFGNVKCKIKNIKYGDSEVIISVIDGRRRGNKTIKFHRRAESYTFVTVKRHALLVIAICIVVNQGTHRTLIETATA